MQQEYHQNDNLKPLYDSLQLTEKEAKEIRNDWKQFSRDLSGIDLAEGVFNAFFDHFKKQSSDQNNILKSANYFNKQSAIEDFIKELPGKNEATLENADDLLKLYQCHTNLIVWKLQSIKTAVPLAPFYVNNPDDGLDFQTQPTSSSSDNTANKEIVTSNGEDPAISSVSLKNIDEAQQQKRKKFSYCSIGGYIVGTLFSVAGLFLLIAPPCGMECFQSIDYSLLVGIGIPIFVIGLVILRMSYKYSEKLEKNDFSKLSDGYNGPLKLDKKMAIVR
jgi:hypothetical protein